MRHLTRSIHENTQTESVKKGGRPHTFFGARLICVNENSIPTAL